MQKTRLILGIMLLLSLCIFALVPLGIAGSEPGTVENIGPTSVENSLVQLVTETGLISLSIDGLGVYPENTGIIQVEKPAGATVRKAYMAAASTGGSYYHIVTGDIKIDGVGIAWDYEVSSSIYSYNYWAEVTSIVKPKIDAAPAGRIDFTITENLAHTDDIDGELLAVIFDDPCQLECNTVVLLFGAQDVLGDEFTIVLPAPIDLSEPYLTLGFSLGISFGYQTGGSQYSYVNINGIRMTSWAGGEDDCVDPPGLNGKLLTVGGLDDNTANPPDPYHLAFGDFRYDDELYNLIDLVEDGDTSITVWTQNPSHDDNIFFGALYLGHNLEWPQPKVIPEVPLGTVVASMAMIIALVAYVATPKWRKKQEY